MKLLLLMSASGSLMVVFYFLFKVFVKGRVSAKWRYRMLKAALFFYLIPVQAVKTQWKSIYYNCYTHRDIQVQWLNGDIIQFIGGDLQGYSINGTEKYLCVATLIITVVVISGGILIYAGKYRTVLHHPAGRNDSRIEEALRGQKDRMGIKRKIACRVYSGSKDAFTMGVFRPIVVLDDKVCSKDEGEMLIRHELLHIKNWDGLIKLLGIAAMAAHFFNPFVYYLFYELSVVSELACDEKVISQMSEEYVKKYCGLLLRIAQGKKGLYTVSFGRGGKKIVKERIEMMLNSKSRKKGWQIFSGVLLSFLVVMVSSMTTFAYEPPAVLELEGSEKEVEHEHREVDRLFVADGCEAENSFWDIDTYEISFGGSDIFFIDEQGNRYDLTGNSGRVICSHTFVSGKYNEHVKNGTGCTVTIYNAQICRKCEYVKVGNLYSQTKYEICPH